ncbi:AarF/UbiB family protein [Breoghania sp. L-A4]|uniref:AarF/UbiB family protein n=1 Tax=Breoghania sp. L-A4 TaxID=2304600 RepID=UPI000E35FA0F|nr:AarF/UbiB family protein [Breoghania sp. L-A4]AXS38988.1 ubiquinone biosynthesis protein UbiB [Breoghania sp. L-A4]
MPVTNFIRLAHAGFVMAREGVFGLVEVPDLPAGPRLALRLVRMLERKAARRADAGARISQAFNRLGPSYVKMGQFLATRPDVVGAEVALELSLLQDQLPPFAQADAIAVVEEAFGQPIDAIFAEFGAPVAAASIAQVHPAVLRNPAPLEDDPARADDPVGAGAAGAADPERDPEVAPELDNHAGKVAVKVLRPGVARRFQRDLQCFYLAARLIERFAPAARRLRPVAIVDTLARSVELEMDFRLEAAALSEMTENIAKDPDFRVPSVDWVHTAKSVLTLEWIDGRKLSDVEGIRADGQDMERLAANIIQSFLRHALRDGFFHADMHQGNLFAQADGMLVAVDFGITGRLNKAERRFLAEILFGFITRNYLRVAEVHFEAGYVPGTQDVAVFAQAIRAIGEPIHGHTASEISMARLLTQLFEVTELFDMTTQPQLIMLQKTMVVVEGVARTLDPKLDMWKTAEPVVREWIERNLGPAGKLQDAGEGFGGFMRLLGDMPVLAERASRMSAELESMSKNGLRFDAETADAIGRAEARHTRSGRWALWIIAAAMVVIALELVL